MELPPIVSRTFGKKCTHVTFDFNGTLRSAWYKKFRGEDTWSESTVFVSKHWKKFSDQDIRLFITNGEFFGDEMIYDIVVAVPAFPVIDIIELVRTGTHNRKPNDWKTVKANLERIMSRAPFEIQFADQAGLHAAFLKCPSAKMAKEFAQIIAETSPEVFDGIHEVLINEGFPRSKMKADDPDETLAMEALIQHIGKFRLWWD